VAPADDPVAPSVAGPGAYDRIGLGYRRHRRPDPRIERQVSAAIGDAATVVNVGAGAGSYEPGGRTVVAVEPSTEMIAQRNDRRRVVRGVGEHLPFAPDTFDVALAVLTIHHWRDWRAGVAEMRRVARRQVLLVYDPDRSGDLWLVREYLPEIAALEEGRGAPALSAVADAVAPARVEVVPVPHDCVDGFQAAYWRRPRAYLDPAVRACISTLAQLDPDLVDAAMARLAADLDSGRWARRHHDLLGRDAVDYGYRLVVGEGREPRAP
jgi:SAM-dependent methyltransferase